MIREHIIRIDRTNGSIIYIYTNELESLPLDIPSKQSARSVRYREHHGIMEARFQQLAMLRKSPRDCEAQILTHFNTLQYTNHLCMVSCKRPSSFL